MPWRIRLIHSGRYPKSLRRRAITVDVVVPRVSDHPFIDWATRAHLDPLLRAGVRLCQDGANVFQRLSDLIGQRGAVESPLRIPADLAGDENLPARG